MRAGRREGKRRRRGGSLSIQLHSSQARPSAAVAAPIRAAHCLDSVCASVRAPNPGNIPRICAPVHVFLRGRYKGINSLIKHLRSTHTHARTHPRTPSTNFLFGVSVYTGLLSKQSKHMSHFCDRWLKPRAT